MITAYPQAC